MTATPYYADESVTLYHGDAVEVLHSLDIEVAAVVTDPPYASGARTEAAKSSSGAMVRGLRWATRPIENDQMTTTGFVWLIREVCYAVRPLLVDGGNLLAFIDWRQWPNLVGAIESTNMRVNGMVVWDKKSYGLFCPEPPRRRKPLRLDKPRTQADDDRAAGRKWWRA